MSILDDAIREHLELKRAHGADEAELKKLEDEAFGPPERPDDVDPLAEAPTEFLGEAAVSETAAEPESGRRVPNIADLQEAPPPPKREEEPVAEEAAAVEPEPALEHRTVPVPQPEQEMSSEDEQPQEASEPIADAGPSTEEREAIADQPTEFFDVEAELRDEDSPDTAEKQSPTDEELLDSRLTEPRLAPSEPIEPLPDEPPSEEYEDEREDDFFSEQRLSDELNQALDAPVTDEHEALPEHEPFSVAEPTPPPAEAEEETAIHDADEDESDEHKAYEPETGSHDDVLEDTPEFLEDAPEDDDLWFEQRPPKDFDFDD